MERDHIQNAAAAPFFFLRSKRWHPNAALAESCKGARFVWENAVSADNFGVVGQPSAAGLARQAEFALQPIAARVRGGIGDQFVQRAKRQQLQGDLGPSVAVRQARSPAAEFGRNAEPQQRQEKSEFDGDANAAQP